MNLSILLADDHPIVRQGMRRLLEAEPGFRVVGEAGDGFEAVKLAGQLRPDVLVLDLMLPGLNGLEVLRQVTQFSSATRVVMLSMYGADAYVVQALRHGAAGYILKDSGPSELVGALRSVACGGRYLSPAIATRFGEDFPGAMNTFALDPYDNLTDRERQAFQLAAEGCTTTEIAERLTISPRTAERHRQNAMDKLHLHSQVDLVRYAIRRGILTVD